jgi:hypothetical protein
MQIKEMPLHIEYALKCLPQWVLVKFYWVLDTPQKKKKKKNNLTNFTNICKLY